MITKTQVKKLAALAALILILVACDLTELEPSIVEKEEATVETVVTAEAVDVKQVADIEKAVEVEAESDLIIIEYWQHYADARVEAMNHLIQQFEAENPDVRVVHNGDIPYAEFPGEVASAIPVQAGIGPDVVTLFYGWVPAWVEAGYLVSLPEDVFPPEVIESAFSPLVTNSKFQGKYWTVPTAVGTLALYWNKDLFEGAGLDPEAPPTNSDEFLEYAIALTQYDDDGNIIVEGFAPVISGPAQHWFREVLVRQYGGVPYSDDNRTVLWNSPAGCQAFTWLAELETVHRTGSDDLFEDATTAFLQGRVAMHIDGPFRLGSIARNAPGLNFGVAELPLANEVQSTFGSYWAHGITPRTAENPRRAEAAVRFLKFITSPEAGAFWMDEVGELPARLEADDKELLGDPKRGPFAAGLPYAHSTFFVDELKQHQFIIDAFDAVRLNGEDPCVALDEAAALEQAFLDAFWASQEQ